MYDQWLTTLSHMVATTLPLVGLLCSAWTVTTYSTLDDILYSTRRCCSLFVSSHVSEIHMSEADLLRECIMIRDKVFQVPDWFMPSNVCQIINYVSCGEWLICVFIVLFLFCVYFCVLCLIFFTVPLVRRWCYWDAVYSEFYFFVWYLLRTLCSIS